MEEVTKNFITQDLKEFYIPLNEIKVKVYKVLARNEEQAIQNVAKNKNKLHKVKVIELTETSPNSAFLNNDTTEYLNKTIDHFEVSEQETKSISLKLIK